MLVATMLVVCLLAMTGFGKVASHIGDEARVLSGPEGFLHTALLGGEEAGVANVRRPGPQPQTGKDGNPVPAVIAPDNDITIHAAANFLLFDLPGSHLPDSGHLTTRLPTGPPGT